MNCRLSIVVTCFERSDYLYEALNSIVCSIEESNENVELIVLDNASLNEEISRIVKKFPMVKFIKNETNLGLFGNWNKAFKVASGEYVSIIGDDDVIDLDYVPTFFSTVSKYKFDIFYTDYTLIDEVGTEINEIGFDIPFGVHTKKEVIAHANKCGFGLPTVTMAYKKSLFDSIGFNEQSFGSNDWVYLYDEMPWEFCYGVDRKLVSYRKHGKGASGIQSSICTLSIFYLMEKLEFKKNKYWFSMFVLSSVSYWSLNVSDNIDNIYYQHFKNRNKKNNLLAVLHNLKFFNFTLPLLRLIKNKVTGK